MEDRIKEILIELGANICRIANIERFANAPSGFHPTDIYKECKSVIVFAKCILKGLAYVNPSYAGNIPTVTIKGASQCVIATSAELYAQGH